MQYLLAFACLLVIRLILVEWWTYRMWCRVKRWNEEAAKANSPLRLAEEFVPHWWDLFSNPLIWRYRQASKTLDNIIGR